LVIDYVKNCLLQSRIVFRQMIGILFSGIEKY